MDYDGAGTFAQQVIGAATPLAVGSNQNVTRDNSPFDGRGDGTTLDSDFQQFTFNFANSGAASTAAVRVTIDGGSTSEEWAFDDLEVQVDQLVPEPSSTVLVLLGGLALLGRRRR